MNARDITVQFHTAASHVTPGTLVKDDHFSLFEAVGALEIGDPKMDSGCLEPGESLQEEFDMTKDFLPEELIWLMDGLLNREVAWLMGYPLSQTLFTSVHIDRLLWPDPKRLEDSTFIRGPNMDESLYSHQVLRAHCLLLIKSCDCVLSMITSQHYYEEEDFTTQLFNRELLHRFSAEDISSLVSQTIQSLDDWDIEQRKRDTIAAHLRFRIDVLEVLTQHAVGQSPPGSLFSIIHESLDTMQRSYGMGVEVNGAFSTKIQRRLASTVPPRPMVTVSMDQAWLFWHNLLGDSKDVFTVHQAGHSQDLSTAYQLFAYSSPQPSTYPRILLQSFLSLGNMITDRLEPVHFLEEDLSSLTLPASPLLKLSQGQYGRLYLGNPKVAECMQIFAEKFEVTFVNVYRALCLNSCRIRRSFCHALIEWDTLQIQVEDIDSILQGELNEKPMQYLPGSPPTFAFSMSSWVYHHKLVIQRLTIQMGFDHMIYAPHEMAGMHWYLSSTCELHLDHLERISHFVTARGTEIKRGPLSALAKANGAQECKLALNRLYQQYAWIKATQLLAGTLHRIFVTLQRFGVFVSQGPLYSADALRYEIRMRPFLGLSIPEPSSPEDFVEQMEMLHLTTDDLLEQATAMGVAARKAWEGIAKTSWHILPKLEEAPSSTVLDAKWQVEVKDSLKAAIAAGLCVLALKKRKDEGAWIVKARKEAKIADHGERGRWHRWWIVPGLPTV